MREQDPFDGLHAIIPTPARSGADRWDATDTVDTEETARLVDTLIRDGASGIIALGTTGECATLTPEEFDTVVGCVVDAAAGRVPTIIGATALGTHEVARRLRIITDRGATGTLLGLPMWQPLTTGMALRYVADAAAAAPGLGIMVYANARAFRYGFPLEFWASLARDVPSVVAAKMSRAPDLPELVKATEGRIRFLPNEMKVHEFHAMAPQTPIGCWATAAAMGPEPALAVLDALRSGEQQAIDAATADIAWACQPIEYLLADQEYFASHNIQVEKVRIEEAGYCRPGPIRPPYNSIADDDAAAARECGRRWRELRERHAAARGTALVGGRSDA
ncbi:dihydrodipicolinate synthase family protein [Streptomyces radicis]|uniref:Aldolase n=1 Tax=Streptomyces radicis TaxID=1750517 RepID=A0A3A9VR09_9ACTN|nr:dihydrodipicolinate synthase family protein [Streptomyces radicis]RKN03465.1 aldolase [Streptomyces radicis]RKN13327.1 aldolase [Streptomyces radicis]